MNTLPFLKWVGGKRKLLPHLLPLVPKKYGVYHEPFLGGGALFFALAPDRAIISDANGRLTRAYQGVQQDVEGVIRGLRALSYDKDTFLRVRAQDVDAVQLSCVDAAVWMVYLNKTCFNGIYRVNSKNIFNVPFGKLVNQVSPNICDEPRLRACAEVLRGKAGRVIPSIQIREANFAQTDEWYDKGDFAYFDPPYVPLSASESFVSYTQDGFGSEDQEKLRDLAWRLKRRGVHVLLSNSATPMVRKLYKDFEIIEVSSDRLVGGKGASRTPVKELIIR